MANPMQLSVCLGGYSVRTGTISIGIAQLILTISVLVLFIFAQSGEVVEIDDIIISICFCIMIPITILLLVGVFKRNTCMMLLWLELEMLAAVILLFKITIVVSESNGPVLFIVFMYVTFFGYSWLVVHSHYQELKNDETGNRICLHEGSHNCISKLEVWWRSFVYFLSRQAIGLLHPRGSFTINEY